MVLAIIGIVTGCGAKGNNQQLATPAARSHSKRYIPNIDYRQVYAGTMGFCLKDGGPRPKAPKQSAYLFRDKKSWQKFKDVYLNGVPVPSAKYPDENMLYVQVDWPEALSGPAYQIVDLTVRDNRLEIEVRRLNTYIESDPASPNIVGKYAIFAVVDGKSLPFDLTPHVVFTSVLDKKWFQPR